MSSEERKQILKMVEDGRISADQAMTLIRALEEDAGAEAETEVHAPEAGPGAEKTAAPDLEKIAAQARRLAQIPLWAGLSLLVLSASAMYAVMQSAGYNFWFYCLMLPLLLGAAVTAFGGWSRTARWFFVRVDRLRGEGPKRILFGFPIPLELAGWFLRVFGKRIDGLKDTSVDEVVQAIALTRGIREPLIIDVDDGEEGEQVQVYIG